MNERSGTMGWIVAGLLAASLCAGRSHAEAQSTPGVVIVPVPSTTPAPVYVQPQPAPIYTQPTYGAQTYTTEERHHSGPNLGLIISGAVLLGVGWISCFLVGLGAGTDPFASTSQPAWDTFRGVGFIPIAGPWVEIGVKPTGFSQDLWGGWLVINGLIQAAGTALLIAGIATSGGDDDASAESEGVRWVLVPTVAPGQAGLALAGTF